MSDQFLDISTFSSRDQLRARVRELEDEISALETRIQCLVAARRRATLVLATITYPISTVPPEILGHIFAFYVDSPCTSELMDGPLRLAAVCRQWRAICFAIPSLWRDLGVFCPASNLDKDSEFEAFLRAWLSRAGTYPIDLWIRRRPSRSEPLSRISPIISLFEQQIHKLLFPLDFWGSMIAPEFRTPRLQALEVIGPHHTISGSTPWCTFTDAPRLCSLKLKNISPLHISIPWSQLTNLEFTTDFSAHSLGILEKIPQLQKLRVAGPCPHGDGISTPPLTLAHLDTLCVTGEVYRKIFPDVILPALETLEHYAGGATVADLRLDLAKRSACTVRTIRLVGGDMRFLRLNPSLVSIALRVGEQFRSNFTLSEFLGTLTTEPRFLPHLRVLKIDQCMERIAAPLVAAMVACRGTDKGFGCARLESFSLSFANREAADLIREIREQLEPTVKKGLKLTLGLYEPNQKL